MKIKKLKVFSTGLLTAVLSVLASTGAQAWGPQRALFTNENPATYATFNSITNNAAVGDERDFVRIVEAGTGNAYANEVKVSGGKEYQVYIYYHNNASSTFNTSEYSYKGVAREVKLTSQFPMQIEAGKKGTVSATISAANTNPAKVWDEAYLSATEKVNLAYKVGSAKIFNDWGANGSVLSTNLFSSEGTYLGLNELNGVILGCDEYSGQVVYTLVATAVEEKKPGEEQPGDEEEPGDEKGQEDEKDSDNPVGPGSVTEDPTPENQPETETPDELPKTGPAEIALAAVIVLGLAAWAIYYFVSKNKLKKVKADVMNSDSGDEGDNKNISQDE